MHYDYQDGEHRLVFANGLCLSWYEPRRYSTACAWLLDGRIVWVGELGRA